MIKSKATELLLAPVRHLTSHTVHTALSVLKPHSSAHVKPPAPQAGCLPPWAPVPSSPSCCPTTRPYRYVSGHLDAAI
eukprot:365907-Chlamydomonas_euryale.AAC.4